MRGGIRLPKLDYRTTSNLTPGSVIEYELERVNLTSLRQVGMIVRIDWAPTTARTQVHVLSRTSGLHTIDMCTVCRVYVL